MGITFAFLALAAWGVGDFLIQRTARKFGAGEALFYITAVATVGLLPFVWRDLGALASNNKGLALLTIASVVLLFAALFEFEALRIGKISVVEPIFALEVPVTAILALIVIGERLTSLQTLLIVTLVCGIMLLSIRSLKDLRRMDAKQFEQGVLYAICATLAMGGANFMFGFGSRATNPLLVNWFTNAFIALVMFGYLTARGQFEKITEGWQHNKRLILGVGIIDNAAWVAFAYSMTYIPIAVATGISESYIAFAAGLGLLINKERLAKHQFLGLAIAIISVILLAAITTD